ncbi:hypothetical protein [Deinococcus cellulosilyticus]|uniref:Uncharacterized protein n=1 Tax=Deinococcus cellulosilyticus (strain DSM 18568 / NBRC 106333 / KACC 11606 / 5516J-15) TaxID=1223518 RepID=A0A511N8G5_DEIC1|nr:hypothetical protein [Deinococcus cellulosilyticus]GEM49133.1 hypothetical protein DC3_47680 [Deinococcus cellulosilyticus NBRC 106333 = KACC 11606]
MSCRAYFIYILDGSRYVEAPRYGGLDVPGHLARGAEWHFARMMRLMESQEARSLMHSLEEGNPSHWRSFYGGYVVDFDHQTVTICSITGDIEEKLEDTWVVQFEKQAFLRSNLNVVLSPYWKGWQLRWTSLGDFNALLSGHTEGLDFQPLECDDAADQNHPGVTLLALQKHYQRFLIRTRSVPLDPDRWEPQVDL